MQGPFNSYEMDNLYKVNKIKKLTKIGISRHEFFNFAYFIEIVYPLPKVPTNKS